MNHMTMECMANVLGDSTSLSSIEVLVVSLFVNNVNHTASESLVCPSICLFCITDFKSILKVICNSI